MINNKHLKKIIFILIILNILLITIILAGPDRLMNRVSRLFYSADGVYIPKELLLGDGLITKDPLSKYQWGLRMMLDGESYWDIQGDAPRDVIVAVIDQGVHMNHPDLVNKQVGGWNFIDNSPELRDDYDGKRPGSSTSHGQAAASIIAAEVDNNIGLAGVFSRAYIMPLQTGPGQTAEAIKFAVNNGADVIMLYSVEGSIAHPMQGKGREKLYPDETLYCDNNLELIADIKKSIDKAYYNRIPIITSVSNTGYFDVTLFAEDYRTISVAAHNIFGEVSAANSFSYSYEVFAPGGSRKKIKNIETLKEIFPDDLLVESPSSDYDDIIVAIGRDGYSFLILQSAAMPHVAGAVAMIKSYLPDIEVAEVREILRDSSLPLRPSGSLLEGLGGRLSLRLVKEEIIKRMD